MKDEEKSKTQLIEELATARQKITELESARSKLKSVEHALRQSEERFRIALQNSNIVVYNQDRDLRYTWIYNPQLGFTPEGILGKTDAQLLIPEDAAPLDRIKRQVLESGTGRRQTVRTTIEGEAYFYDLTVEPLRDAGGQVVGVTGASRDITEQVRVNQALRESEEKYRTLFETMAQGVVYHAVKGEIISANPAASRILGLTLDQMQGRTSVDPRWRAVHEDGTDFPGETHPAMVALRTAEPVRDVVMGVFNPQTEQTVWIRVNATPLFRPGENAPYRVYATFEDITGRRQAEQALQEERDRAQRYLDIAGIILVIEPDQTVSLLNKRGREILGHEEHELLGRNWFDTCIPAGEQERLKAAFEHLMQGAPDPPSYMENTVLTKAGEERIIAWRNTVLRDDAGAIVGSLSSGEDITERVRAEADRDAMLAALRRRSHDLDERVKELNCLYGLSRLRERPGVSLEEIYRGTAELIPPAWWHPEITGARVVMDDLEYRTERFCADAPYRQTAEIVVHGRVCGAVEVCCVDDGPASRDGPFLAGEQSLLNAIAERLGRTTEHMRAEAALLSARDELELRVQERTAELHRGHERERILNALLRLSMEEISLDEQLERALDEILSIPWLPVQSRGGIFLAANDTASGTPCLELRAQRGFDATSAASCARVDFGQCLCGRAAASRMPLYAGYDDERHEIEHRNLGPHGHYCLPIVSGDKTLGAIVLYAEHGVPPGKEQQEFLAAVAHTLAGIIERKRVEEALRQSEGQLLELNRQLADYGRQLEEKVAERTGEIERRREVAESLHGILAVLNSNRPLDEILGTIVAEARRLLGSDTSAIYDLDEATGTFEVQAVQGQHADLVVRSQLPPAFRQALQHRQPIAVSDAIHLLSDTVLAGAGADLMPAELAERCPAMLAVPLLVAGEIYGWLVLYYADPREFSGEEVDLALAFADQAALGIENARLHLQAEEAAVLRERSRLARDLHDSVTQSLYSITLLAEGWKRLERAGKLADSEEPLAELGEIAQQALKEMRLLVHELRPPDLEEVGLVGALHQRLGAVEKRAGVDARLVAGDVVDLPPRMEEGLYRIAIEALNNALKHASATSVVVRVVTGEDGLVLEVVDDGCGFDASRIDQRRGVGLGSMHERAERLGGRLAVESAPGQGTKIRAIVGTRGKSEERAMEVGQ